MDSNRTVRYIPPYASLRETKVGIYCRVSTNSSEQLESLSAQVSALTRLVAATPQWVLVDIYMDVASAKGNTDRKEYKRMLEDVKAKKVKIVLTKSVSRFGRDTIETLEALQIIRESEARIIFEQEQLDSADTDSSLMISIIESLAQSENENRSENIKWGLKRRAAQGTSRMFDKKCYGYDQDENGKLIIKESEADIVRKIYSWYLAGKTSTWMVKELYRLGIKSSKGKDKWCKQSIDAILQNEKYTGSVRLFDSNKREIQYLSEDNHPAIIGKDAFTRVHEEKKRRSNVVSTTDGVKRKSEKYSSKQGDNK